MSRKKIDITKNNFASRLIQLHFNSTWLLTGEGEMKKPLAKYENKEHNIGYVDDPGQVYDKGIVAGYPLMKKLINEAEEAKRLGLSEEELTDLLLHICFIKDFRIWNYR